jgi:hypothetical protein
MANLRDRLERTAVPSSAESPGQSRRPALRIGSFQEARDFIAAWHSRLPKTVGVPASVCFIAEVEGALVAAAMWGNTSARGCPQDWLELRRFAIRTDGVAPPHCASWMLGAMRRQLRSIRPDVSRLISYQDVDVHTGTIYRAAGWVPASYSPPRARDRSKGLKARKTYRTDSNGAPAAAAGKIRWEIALHWYDPKPEARSG